MSNVSRNEMLVGVDIGTSKVVAIVAELRGSQLEIIGLGTHASKGLKNGVVVDIESTTTAIKKSIQEQRAWQAVILVLAMSGYRAVTLEV